ncbi:hypothetical protein K450DRAFT_290638 [Umbelopsis ramanniana AG]|uniref:Uncharacterized protein n=1 Tax=Umbelopsis ramanniana AG TaxID=1314678 RepID=A0AAD5E4J4_UMBRA|nr:uncharacterized protein K450DRAFT_290638 [Umbelopsis ramanniana AG]KAI8577251.1 hypothetical protein K450DRAFT_290638 [Umbelopsis ramanniana AG]
MNRTKSVGLDQLITAAEQRDVRNSERIEVAIVHRIRSLMLLEINGAEQHMGRQEYKSYHRLQCCQFEHYEFERLFSDFNAQYQTIRLGDKPLIGESAQDAQKRKVEKLLPLNLFRSAEWPTTPRFPYHRAPSSNSAEHFFRLEKNRHRKTHPLLGLSKSVDNVEKSSFRQKSTINHSLSISNEDSENSDPEDDEYRTTKPIRNWHYTESSNVADNNRNCHILELVSKHQYLLSDVVEAIIAIGAALNDDSVQTLEIRHAQHDNNHPSPVKLVATIFHYVLLNSELANNIFTTAKKSETSLRHALYEVHGDDNTLASRVGTLHYRLYEMMKDVLMSEETTIPDHNVEIINTPILLAFLEVYCRPELREFQNKMRTCTDRVPLSTKLMTTVYAKHYSLTGLVDNHIEITSEVHNGDSILPTDIVHVNGDRELLDKLDTKGIVAIKMSTELVKGNISDVYMLAKKQNDSYHCLLYCTLTPGAVAFLKLLGSERKNIVVAGIWENPNPIIPYYPCKKCGVVPNAVSIVTDLDQVGNSILASVYHYSTPGNISVRIDCGQNLKEISLSQRLKCMTVSENDLFVISLNRLMDGYKHGTIPIIPYDQEFHICDEMIAFALLPPAYREATIKLCFAKDAVHIYPDQNFAYLKEIKEGESSDHTRWLVKKVHMYRETVKDLASRESDAAESLENRVKQVIAIVKAATKGVPFVDMGSAAEVATLKWKKKVGDRNRYEVTEKLRTIHAELVAEANFSAVSMLLSYRFNSDFAKSAFTGEYMCFLGSENDFTGPMPPYYKFRVYQLALIGVIYTWRKYGQNIEISAQSINHDDKTRKVAYLNDSGDIHVSSAFEFGKVGESMMTEHIVGNLSASSTHNDIHNRNIPRACNLESFGLFTRFIIIMKRRFKKKRDQMWRQEL